jgi:DNA-binding transcriptional LysR family regulator
MNIDVSLRLLRAFVAVAREGHVGRAAQRLYVSQPSLSQDIRRLERRIGVELFLRGARGMELTAAGDALLAGVECGLLAVDRAVAEAGTLGGAAQRTVSICFSPSIGNRLMPGLIPILDRRMPEVGVDEREVDTGEVGPGVREGRYDLGFAHCPTRERDLAITPVVDERMCAAVAADHPVAGRNRTRLSDLAGMDIVLWPRETAPDYYDHLLLTCTQAGFTPAVVQGPRRAIIRSYLLADRTAFCLLPASTAQLSVPGVAFIDIVDEHARVPLVSVRRADDSREDVLAVERVARSEGDRLLGR